MTSKNPQDNCCVGNLKEKKFRDFHLGGYNCFSNDPSKFTPIKCEKNTMKGILAAKSIANRLKHTRALTSRKQGQSTRIRYEFKTPTNRIYQKNYLIKVFPLRLKQFSSSGIRLSNLLEIFSTLSKTSHAG